jgi:hypothetical protein
MTAADIEKLIIAKHPKEAWAVLPQVRNGTGFARNPRTADVLAMSLWPSRGIFLHGFEIKVSKNDWKTELLNPAKAEAIAQYCGYWWIAAPADVVNVFELPVNWGLMAATDKTLKIVKQAIQ